MEAATPESAQSALSGLNAGGIGLGERSAVFFDLGAEDIAAIICSTNTLLADQGAYVPISIFRYIDFSKTG